jgi:hypothetical protein
MISLPDFNGFAPFRATPNARRLAFAPLKSTARPCPLCLSALEADVILTARNHYAARATTE